MTTSEEFLSRPDTTDEASLSTVSRLVDKSERVQLYGQEALEKAALALHQQRFIVNTVKSYPEADVGDKTLAKFVEAGEVIRRCEDALDEATVIFDRM